MEKPNKIQNINDTNICGVILIVTMFGFDSNCFWFALDLLHVSLTPSSIIASVSIIQFLYVSVKHNEWYYFPHDFILLLMLNIYFLPLSTSLIGGMVDGNHAWFAVAEFAIILISICNVVISVVI